MSREDNTFYVLQYALPHLLFTRTHAVGGGGALLPDYATTKMSQSALIRNL